MASPSDRVAVERLLDPERADTLAEDVRRGLAARPKWLPPKHFYDAVGGALFERICDLPEYYPTRTEQALLERHAEGLMARLRPRHLVELGSGSSRKTRLLLSAMGALGKPAAYHPIDINESLLAQTATRLASDYPWLAVRARVADFEQPLPGLPTGPGVLVAFLGGTVGNFEERRARALLASLSCSAGRGAMLLLGTDTLKDEGRLNAAYNDAQGVTARFNLNVLSVINQRLGADFDLRRFEHLAFFHRPREQVEMHLRSKAVQRVRIERLGLSVEFDQGETIRTEVSRKFTPESGRRLLEASGWRLVQRLDAPGGDYALWIAQAAPALLEANPLASPGPSQ